MLLSTSPNMMESGAGQMRRADPSGSVATAAKLRNPTDTAGVPAATKCGSAWPWREDDESTEATSCSDAETACSSSAAGGSDSGADDEAQGARRGPMTLRAFLGHHASGRSRLSAAARKHRSRCLPFTPMDPIPGTPNGMAEHPPLFFAAKEEVEPSTGARLPQALLATAPQPTTALGGVPRPPPSPKRRARAAVMERAREAGAPLKVSMLQDVVTRGRKLDPTFPAKKRPILPDALPGLRNLQPGLPVKKRITPWLTAEPARVLPAAPR